MTTQSHLLNCMPSCNIISWNAMLSTYIHHGYFREAVSLFDAMPIGDAYSWTVIIKGLANNDQLGSSKKLFEMTLIHDIYLFNIQVDSQTCTENTYYDNIKSEYIRSKAMSLFKFLNIVILISCFIQHTLRVR
ncbi:hypothetical protein AMTRI_Chr09g17440 [Amborella trichopoda]